MEGQMEGRKDRRTSRNSPCVQQDIGPLGPLPKKGKEEMKKTREERKEGRKEGKKEGRKEEQTSKKAVEKKAKN